MGIFKEVVEDGAEGYGCCVTACETCGKKLISCGLRWNGGFVELTCYLLRDLAFRHHLSVSLPLLKS